MKPEEEARQLIDQQLELAGWQVQEFKSINLGASLGVAVTEFPTQAGQADYVLFTDRKAVGVIEAKPEGTTLGGVAEQTAKYIHSFPENIPHFEMPLPFAYESTGVETYFRDERDPFPRSRRVFAFHRPETLLEYLKDDVTLRGRLKQLPPLNVNGLRDCQIEAITNLEQSFHDARPKALIQMATGTGKTYTAVSFVYRLIKFAKARRILFLVDRRTLGRQTRSEFQQYITPDDGRKFTELYNVQLLASNTIDPVCKVSISTIQRLYSMLKGEELDKELDEVSLAEMSPDDAPEKEVAYNPNIPIETYDFIITDECHRSIYNQWRQVLDYFDAFIIGLTATPSKQTFGFFDQNLVMEYNHERAVADRVNVGYEVYRIKTEITEKGSKVDAGHTIDKRDRHTRQIRWEQLDEVLEYTGQQLDRDVVAPDQIRTVIKTFKEQLFTEVFPGRTEVPKTLVFAKDDSHAEDIMRIVREEFGKGNEFCKKITYKTTGDKPENLIASFRNSYNPRIAVSVDMISTGTDIRPLECLLFMRDVKSRVYFEQMKGRGTRVISSTDLKAVTPDTEHKTHFIIVDAVGVTESDKTESRPLERKRTVSFEKLVSSVAVGTRDEDTLISLAGRLSRLSLQIDEEEEQEISDVSGGKTLPEITHGLLDAIDPDRRLDKAREITGTDSPTDEHVTQATELLTNEACAPFDDPKFRETLVNIHKRQYQVIDTVSRDRVISTGMSGQIARNTVDNFRKFIESNKDEILALQIIYNQPYDKRHITYEMIRQLARAMEKPPYNLSAERVWTAYEQLEKSKVRQAGPQRLLTDIISLVRFSVGKTEVLTPFQATVEERFADWLENQRKAGNTFTPEQADWLTMIKDHIATSMEIKVDDFDNVPFYDKGGAGKANVVFGERLNPLIDELNQVLAA